MRRNIRFQKTFRRTDRVLSTAMKASARCLTLCATLVGLAMSGFGQEPLPPGPLPPTAAEPARIGEAAPATTALLLQDRPIGQLQATITAPTMNTPENLAQLALHEEGTRPQPLGLGRGWCLQPLQWEASAVRHRPAYFEEPNLERLGYYYGSPCLVYTGRGAYGCWQKFWYCGACPETYQDPWYDPTCGLEAEKPHLQLFQPLVSAANFYGRVVALPYMIGTQYPNEEVYSLGEDRPGSPVPYRKYYIPLSIEGAVLQGFAATGVAFLIP